MSMVKFFIIAGYLYKYHTQTDISCFNPQIVFTLVAELLPTISLATLASTVQTAAALMQGKATLAPLHVVCLVGSDS